MPVSGQIVGGRYRLVRPLGEGGMATVWAAEHLTMGNLVAVKIISTELLDCELAITRFSREARAAAKLRSPYVVQLFDHDVDPVVGPYIAMELLEGESLAERLEREVTLPPKELCRILHQVGKGLMRAHAEGVVHRDMKPDNIFLAIDDEAMETAKILDFGVAKADSPFAPQGNKTVAGALVGTLFYMSPEQAQGREVDHLTDLWALGVIAFESLVGKRPFDDAAPGAVVMQICANPMAVPSRLNPEVPPGFDAWFAQACNRDPAKRFPSADELAQSLAHVCDADELSLDDVVQEGSASEDDVVTSAPKVEKLRRPRRKRPVLQLVDSSAPPPPDPAQDVDDMLSLDVEFEFEIEYFVAYESSVVGPVSLETVEAGYRAGHVTIGTWLWAEGWPAWRKASEVFAALPGRRRKGTVPNLELVGPRCSVPSGAPAVPVEPAAPPARASSPARRRASKRPGPIVPPPPPPPPARHASPPPPSSRGSSAPPAPLIPPAPPPPNLRASLPRPVPAAKPVSAVRPAPTAYYLTDGAITVGPVRASMLRTGMDAGKFPETVLAWRPGWKDWKPISELRLELEAAPPAPVGMLRSRPGVEAVGLKCRMPVAAPAVASDSAGRSKG